jgi:hypothetical protein
VIFRPLLVFLLSLSATSAADTELFEKHIRPILAQECYECHATATQQKGGLVVDHRAGLLAGGDSGPAIVPGDAKASLLLQTLRHEHKDLKMPKNGGRLEEAVLEAFAKWINQGAADPRDAPPSKEQVAAESAWPAVLERRKQWWSLLPLLKTEGQSVDGYLAAARSAAGLKTAQPTDPATLLRRLHFVITGLAPTLAEVVAFEAKPDVAATVDELLSRRSYAEKWARHWMDWVRYAESYGSEGDPAIPYAWRYRDYLVRAFHADVPYDQMLREAVAGDLLTEPRIQEGVNESALGIGQLRMVLHGFSPTDTLDEMVTFTDNQIDVVSKAFQGMTLSCARCHNHKFDALSQADFYSWFGIFSSTHPAVIDASLPGSDAALRTQLLALKQELRALLAKAWSQAPEVVYAGVGQELAEKPSQRWDFSQEQVHVSGAGLAEEATKAGEFSLTTDGDSILEELHPAGRFTDLLSRKDRAVLQTKVFRNEGGTLWLRCAGAGEARVRYIVQNYPRTGTVHKTLEFKKDSSLRWQKLDLDYWKGDDVFIECSTAADRPVDAGSEDAESWFGITEAVVLPAGVTPPEPQATGSVRAAVEAWAAGKCSNAEAELLTRALREKKLPNSLKALPESASLLKKYRELASQLTRPIRAPGVLEAEGRDAPLFVRGDHKQPAAAVRRHFLDAIDAKPFATQGSGRLQLAESLVAESNPLTRRVIVNRLWHHVFGAGIVRSTDNFGRLGELPSHPELLDWLASEFARGGWRIKPMLKMLLTSEAFALSSDAADAERDPENRLLGRWSLRRLEAEAIRDALVNLTGKLEAQSTGPSRDADKPVRSVFTRVIRNNMDPLLAVFDQPLPSSTRGSRDTTNVPAQSLALINAPLVQSWCKQWIGRLPSDPKQRVQQMLELAYSRRTKPAEISAAQAFLQSQGGEAEAEAWSALALALVNGKEFIFLR